MNEAVTSAGMTAPEGLFDPVLLAAFELFTQFGYRKTAMRDVALRAGISRPTLYARFDSKEHLFASVIDRYTKALAEEATRRADDAGDSCADKLSAAVEVFVISPFIQAKQSPVIRELMETTDPRVQDTLLAIRTRFATLLEHIVQTSSFDAAGAGLTAPQLGQLLHMCVRGCKENAKDINELRRLLQSLTHLIAAAERGARN